MSLEVWFAGLPSQRHGAGTEMDHLIDLFRARGVAVHLVGRADPGTAADLTRRGCTLHEDRPGIFAGRVVLAFADPAFLARLPEIAHQGRPKRVVWFNCGVHPMAEELAAHAEGLIDLHGFVSRHQRDLLEPALAALRPAPTFAYRPYLNLARIEWRYRPWNGVYAVGRISRDDPRKYTRDAWRIFERIETPPHLDKQVNILGFGLGASTRTGPPPRHPRFKLWRQGEITPAAFYRATDTLVYKTGGQGESYGRVVVEACAHGVVPVVEHAHAFPELVVHGETGFLARDSDELSRYASLLAAEPERHFAMSRAARAHVERLMDIEACWSPWPAVLDA